MTKVGIRFIIAVLITSAISMIFFVNDGKALPVDSDVVLLVIAWVIIEAFAWMLKKK